MAGCLTGSTCTYEWATKSYVVKKGTKLVWLYWYLDPASGVEWEPQNGVEPTLESFNDPAVDLVGPNVDQFDPAIFTFQALNLRTAAKPIEITLGIRLKSNNARCEPATAQTLTVVLEGQAP